MISGSDEGTVIESTYFLARWSLRWLQMASGMPPRGPKTAPRRLQVATEPLKDTLEWPKLFTILRASTSPSLMLTYSG